MIAGIFIITVSAILFAYWLRYSCVLLMSNAEESSAMSTEFDSRFNVSTVMERLKTEDELGPLERALERDYHVVTYLIQHAADLELGSIENRLLILDYRLMRVWSRITRTLAPVQSRRALVEMASVLSVLVHQMGAQQSIQVEV
uniref:Uncharacterized protein n=1 Tax=Solibacter usitatus (strain Ellin6076) TaxID=234267 RepID=Q01UH6_SOLUE